MVDRRACVAGGVEAEADVMVRNEDVSGFPTLIT